MVTPGGWSVVGDPQHTRLAMRPLNAPPGLLHHPVPGSRGTTPAYIRTGMRFTVPLHCCAEYPREPPPPRPFFMSYPKI